MKNNKSVVLPEMYPNFRQTLDGRTGFERMALTALPFVPRHAYHPFLREIRVALKKLVNPPSKVRKSFRNRKNLKVNVGPGMSAKEGWVNIDIFQFPGVNCIYDCRRSLPFADQSAAVIFTEHFFEHIEYVEEAPFFLSECYRVLQPNGVLRVIVPDVEKYVRAYCKDGWEDLTEVRPLKPDHTDVHFGSRFQTKMEVLNAVFRQHFEHKFAYDFPTLELSLKRAGFSDVRRQTFGTSLSPDLCIDNPTRVSESLYVEAIKTT
jgi:predicted SAM-dependent methyltransferase